MPVLESSDVAQSQPVESAPSQVAPVLHPRGNVRWRLAQVVIVAALTVCLLEGLARVIAAVGQYNPLTTDEFYVKKALAETPGAGPSILFMGSSYTDRSIYADLLTEQLHRAGYAVNVKNLAMLGRGGAPQPQLKLLQAAVKANGKPLAVFYDISPLLGFLAAREQQSLLAPESTPYLLLYREKYASLLRVLPSVITAPDTTPPGVFGVRQDHISPMGWNPNFGLVDRTSLDQSIEVRKKLIGQEKVGADCFDLLAPVRDYCVQNGVPLIFIWYPTTEASDDLYAEHGVKAQDFASQCAEFANKSHTSFLNLHQKMNRLCFSDCDHVNVNGAQALTQRMAQILTSDPFRRILTRSQQ